MRMDDFDLEVGFRGEAAFEKVKDRRKGRERGRRSREKSVGLALSVLFTLLEKRKGAELKRKRG